MIGAVKVQETASSPDGVVRLVNYCLQEELQPLLPRTSLTDLQKMVIVFLAMALKKGTEIKQGPIENAALAEKESDEKPSDTPITIEERMNSLKLVMDQGQFNQWRQLRIGMQEFLQLVKGFLHLCHGRRHKSSIIEGTPWRANPVLGLSELTRSSPFTAHSFHKNGM